jgi:hypothetical protein
MTFELSPCLEICLALRLRLALQHISASKFAFLKGRQILDSVVIINEAVDFAQTNIKKDWLIFKVDFEKAYNLVR